MQGTLGEIDIRSILQLIELGQRTGELLVEAYPSSGAAKQSWFVFFVNGQITYAAQQTNSNSRLQDYLKPLKAGQTLQQLSSSSLATMNIPEYAYLWKLIEKNVLNPSQGRSIIGSMIQETLFDLLSLRQGKFIFEMGSALAPQLFAIEIAPLLATMMQQVQQWKQFHPLIQHPNQYFIITEQAQLQTALPENAYLSLMQWSGHKTTLRQLSRYLRRDLVAIASTLYPYIERGWLQLLSQSSESWQQPPLAWEDDEPQLPHIVCVDDDRTIGKQVEYILQQHGYQSTLFNDPLQALSQVFQIKPDLILCDIAMPELDGYELCGMLRQASAFRQIPIVMLTGKDAFIDRVRAKMVGATDYLTKPFKIDELLLLLEKYTVAAHSSH